MLVSAAVIVTLASQAQSPQTPAPSTQRPAQPTPSADPYANNPDAGKSKFPLATPAGVNGNARTVAPAGALNQGPFDPGVWKYGAAFNPPADAKLWNPVKLKMMQGGKGDGRHGLLCHRSLDVLRDGECRI